MNQVIESFYMSSSVRIRLIILRCVIYLYCLSSWFTKICSQTVWISRQLLD
nr:MAG TPA: hypothetical protein [Bacteriophage sp.]